MDRDNGFDTYLASLSKKREPKPKKGKSKGDKEARRNNSEPIIQRFSLGCQIWSYMQLVQGKDYAQRVLEKEVRKISNGFWIGFIEEERNLRYSTAHRLHHFRALRFYLECKRTGNTTPATVLKGEKKTATRTSGGKDNASKCPALGHQLLQYFVDFVQVLASRADSNILLEKARCYRTALLNAGWEECALPKLDGAGRPGVQLHHMEGSSKQNTLYNRSFFPAPPFQIFRVSKVRPSAPQQSLSMKVASSMSPGGPYVRTYVYMAPHSVASNQDHDIILTCFISGHNFVAPLKGHL